MTTRSLTRVYALLLLCASVQSVGCGGSAGTGWLVRFRKEVDPTVAGSLLPSGLLPVLYPSATKVWTNITYADMSFTHYTASPQG